MASQSEARTIVKEGITIDGLIASNYGEGIVHHLLECGVTAGNWTAGSHSDDMLSAMRRMEVFRWIVGRLPGRALIIEGTEDIDVAQREGKFGIIMGFQGAEPIGSEFHLLSIFWRLGLRILGLTYNQRNLIGDGCLEPENRGLTHFGIQIVRDCNSLGVVVDLSHSGEKTSLDAIDVSRKPCIFSHSNPAMTQSNPRNVTDRQMKAVAEKGGVIGLAAFADFVADTRGGRLPTIDDLIKQFEYAVDLVGIDHVGIGSDAVLGVSDAPWWDNNTKRRYPELTGGMTAETHQIKGYEDYGGIIRIAEGLLKRGYSRADLGKILGGNFHRVFSAGLSRSR